MMNTRHQVRRIEEIEVAKIVRKELKVAFPGQKFSVRTHKYAGGSSIHVNWVDGPTLAQVDPLIGHYHGATFDGMIDLQSNHDTMVMTGEGPEVVHYANDYLFTQREVSDGARVRVIEMIAADNPWRAFDPETFPNESIDGDKFALVRDGRDGVAIMNGYVSRGWDLIRFYAACTAL